YSIFFFQAEDGIRDFHVTGVQTCALPICATRGVGEAVRVEDPFGFPLEFYYDTDHVERFTRRYETHGAGAIARLDHFNIMTPDVPLAQKYYQDLGFRVSEDIKDDEGTVYAS